ncbi:MAG: hypothetical protein V1816_24365 [Pseudomonadota bacterium]
MDGQKKVLVSGMEAVKKHFSPRLILAAGLIIAVAAWAMDASAGETVSVAGLVQDTGDGLILESGDEIYLLEGNVVDEMIGQKVIVTGELELSEGGAKFLIVDSYEEVRD